MTDLATQPPSAEAFESEPPGASASPRRPRIAEAPRTVLHRGEVLVMDRMGRDGAPIFMPAKDEPEALVIGSVVDDSRAWTGEGSIARPLYAVLRRRICGTCGEVFTFTETESTSPTGQSDRRGPGGRLPKFCPSEDGGRSECSRAASMLPGLVSRLRAAREALEAAHAAEVTKLRTASAERLAELAELLAEAEREITSQREALEGAYDDIRVMTETITEAYAR